MLSLKENETKAIIDMAYEFKDEKCGSVYNNADGPVINTHAMEDADDEYCNGLYFKEITGNPLACIRRWDIMRYFLSYDEIDDKLKHGPMKLMNKIIGSIIAQKPYNKVVVVVAIPTDYAKITRSDLNNYLQSGNAPRDVIEDFNRLNNDGILTYLPVCDDPLKNLKRLFNRMINMGIPRVVEGEYEPGEFVLITSDISYFVNKANRVFKRQMCIQVLLSKGIRIVELNDRSYISNGQNLVNRFKTNAYLYFPTRDTYAKVSGVKYEDSYIKTEYTEANYNVYNGHDPAMIYLVPTENKVFPFRTFRQIIIALMERTISDSHYNSNKDIYSAIYSMNESDNELGKEIMNMNTYPSITSVLNFHVETKGQITTEDCDVFEKAIKKEFVSEDNYNLLFFHIPNCMNVSFNVQIILAGICNKHNVTLIFLQEDPRETAIYEEMMKRK